MTGIFLFIADGALREAILEQIKASKLGEPQIVETGPALLKLTEGESSGVIIIDTSADKKIASLVQTLGERSPRPTILLLGAALEDDLEGASETFVKPLRLGHLIARLRYYLETAPLLRDRIIEFGPYRLEPQNRRIIAANNLEPIRLTEKETALLVFLARSPEPVTRRDLLAAVWGYDERIDTHTLETHVYQLRRKLDSGESFLVNEMGAYRLARGND